MELFTKAKAMIFPRQVLAGHDVLGRIAEMCKDFRLKGTAVVVTGKTTIQIAGRVVSDTLTDAGYEVHIIELDRATRKNVDKAKALTEETGAEFLLGIGGGSKIDIAKLAAKECFKPFISVPTSGAHDGIASPLASVDDSGVAHSIEAVMPLAVLADTGVIAKSPFRLLASGCADVIANLTSLRDWQLAVRLRGEDFSTTAFTLAKMSADVIMQNTSLIKPQFEESAWVAIKPIISSGLSMSVAGSSRPTSGAEHMFSHALSRIAPERALHGEQCGVGAIMMMNLHGGPWENIRDALQALKAPVSFRGLNCSEDDIIEALIMAHSIRPERYTILGDKGLTVEAARSLAKRTGVI